MRHESHRFIRGLAFASALVGVSCADGPQSALEGSGSPSGSVDGTNPAGSSSNGDDGGATTGDAGGGGGVDGGGGGGGGGGGTPGDSGPTVPPPAGSTLFPSDSPFYRDVSSAPVSAESAGIIAAIGSWGNSNHFDIDMAFKTLHAGAGVTRYVASLDPSYDPDNDHDSVPVPPGGALEGESGYVCTTGGDCHLTIIDDAQHKLYEIWQGSFSGSKLSGTNQATWDLLTHYGAAGRGYGCTSADAAGLPITALNIGAAETRAGTIGHALRFILPNTKIRSAFVAPASHLTSAASSKSGPPYGTRLRLKSSFDETRVTSTGGRVVVRALKKYGMFLADGGQVPMTSESDALMPAGSKWAGVLGATDLRPLAPSDFEVVEFTTPRTDKDCVRVPSTVY